MKQMDWVGDTAEAEPFKDIRNQRDAIADRKAQLCMELGAPVKTIRARIKSGGSIQDVREWKQKRDAAAKVVGNKRCSIPELEYQIRQMKGAA